VDEDTIEERQSRLMEVQQKISARKLKRFRGQRATALVEGPSKDTPLVWEARLEGMAPEIDGKLYLNDIEVAGTTLSAQTGDIVTVEITETHEYDLVGRVVEILDVPRAMAARDAATAPVQRVLTTAALRILG
jgi:ribosomal protein S12 methylthiotransferase